ncbi:MAG: hypothetical protein HY796_05425 [Elusimicrobia bacterium]|nr:hypothetical protein [Elusimicrobiota bacterium]
MKNRRSKFLPAALLVLQTAGLGALELTKADFPGNAPGSPAAPSASSGTVALASGPQKVKTAGSLKADFTFSGVLVVKNMAFEKNAVVMPVTAYKDRTYTDIKLLSKGFYMKIQACFARGECASRTGAAAPVIKVEEVKLLKSRTRVANAEVSFDGELKVTFGVMKNRSGELWVVYPGNFEVADAAFKSAIAKAVKEAYAKASITAQQQKK